MCTLTFLPAKNSQSFIVTSNRDESVGRGTLPPEIYSEKDMELCYPKDKVAGGSWIGASSRKRLACLMNGGFKPHRRMEKYRMSRGLVLKELLLAENGEKFLENIDLNGIEPFTIVNIEWKTNLHILQLVWDGIEKHIEMLPAKSRIWSASMLYSEETKRKREKLFDDFLKNIPSEINEDLEKKLLDFHHRFLLDHGNLKTTSITQFVHRENSKMLYEDLLSGKKYSVPIAIGSSLSWQ